jgi:hypothetical protein
VAEGTFAFTTIAASTDGPEEPGCAFPEAPQIELDVWYCYTASATGTATASACGSGFDTRLAVYPGCGCPASAVPIACNEDFCAGQSQVSFAVTGGQEYLVRVGGSAGAAGSGSLSIVCDSSAVPNDLCTGATPVTPPTFFFGTTIGALPDLGIPGCGTPIAGPSVWYRVAGTGAALTATTCALNVTDFDTVINVYCGSCDGLACVASNDDALCEPLHSEVTWCSEAGREYFIAVHGFAGATGDFDMVVSGAGPPCKPPGCGP